MRARVRVGPAAVMALLHDCPSDRGPAAQRRRRPGAQTVIWTKHLQVVREQADRNPME
jgi:hypothetical protein